MNLIFLDGKYLLASELAKNSSDQQCKTNKPVLIIFDSSENKILKETKLESIFSIKKMLINSEFIVLSNNRSKNLTLIFDRNLEIINQSM